MNSIDWIRSHKTRSLLIALAVADATYLIWCVFTDREAGQVARLLVPVILISGSITLKRDLREKV